MTELELCCKAMEAKKRAYAPYSGFCVGAALLTATGKVYTGCNVENAAFSPTICAERTAVVKAVSEGERDFSMLAIVGGKGACIDPATPPCGLCRQVLAEFCAPDFPILLVQSETEFIKCTLGDLLPMAFGPGFVKE
ncbi:MAG: cytidine deaminase [Ruminococcaceae bacterium]|nr:cytidine deaminase [Oscillospiraceae bacterium]